MNRLVSVAPMMDCTDRHERYFLRLISKNVLLYTEMIVSEAIDKGDKKKLLDFNIKEKPVALQLGGSSPKLLSNATKVGESFGYDEINLNLGCPSKKVQKNKFGACLMKEPNLVADCLNEMVSSTRDMNDYIIKKKEKTRALIKHEGVKETDNDIGCDLTNDRPENYSSSIFSSLNFEDLKKAHRETLIPVTHQDFIEKEKYSSLNHLQQTRSNQNTTPLSLTQSKDFLNKRTKTAEEINTTRAFKLAKQAEEAKKLHKSFFQQYNQLTKK